MSEPTLEQLARLRGEAVAEAARALAEAERARDAQASVCDEARARADARRRALAVARAQFASSTTVTALHWASGSIERALASCAEARSALLRAEHRLAAAERVVATGVARVRTCELARRAITRPLTRRAHAVTLRTERRLEDELDDAVRTRTYTP